MLATMERFLMSPFHDYPGAMDRIRHFVLTSPDVLIQLNPSTTPFLDEDMDDGVKTLLMTAFWAGNAASQLRTGVKRDDPIAGVEGELAVYLMLKAYSLTTLKGTKVISPKLDEFLSLQRKRQLQDHLARQLGGAISRPVATVSAQGRAAADEEPDEEHRKLVEKSMHLTQAGRHEDAIQGVDRVIASYQARYATDRRRIYCTHETAETVKYMLDSAHDGKEAIAIGPEWADAWYVKSHALTELGRAAEARAALEHAIALSPHYSHYLSELGYLHNQAKNWNRSLELYRSAEESVALMTDADSKLVARKRALRGQAYALVELGELDAAEQACRKILALDPDDSMAKDELEYIVQRRENAKE